MQIGIRGLAGMLCGVGLLLGAERAEATTSSGACCQVTNECITTDQFSCEEAGGTYFGDSTTCANVPCGLQTSVPVFSLLGLVGVTGALAGLGLFRLIRRPRRTTPGAACTTRRA